jgi:hypothetical protein
MQNSSERLLYPRKDAAFQLGISIRALDYLVANRQLETRPIRTKSPDPARRTCQICQRELLRAGQWGERGYREPMTTNPSTAIVRTERIPGVLERVPGSGVWWIRYTDASGRRHLEKAGRRGDAVDLLAKRKHEVLLKKKLPEKLRGKALTFGQLAKDALAHSKGRERRAFHT